MGSALPVMRVKVGRQFKVAAPAPAKFITRSYSMKVYGLKRQFNGYKKGTEFYLISESEFIGIKEFVLRTKELTNTIIINERELLKNFTFIREIF